MRGYQPAWADGMMFLFIFSITVQYVRVLLISVRCRLNGLFTSSPCSIIPLPIPFYFPIRHIFLCSARLSIVWDAGKAGWLSREPAAESKHKTFDWGVRGCACRYLTVELPTQSPVWAAVSPDTMQHGKGGAERGRGEGYQLRQPCTMQQAAQWDVYWVKAHCASVVCSTASCCAEHKQYVACGFDSLLFYLVTCVVLVSWLQKYLSGFSFLFVLVLQPVLSF